jgi:hypothetical protein
VALCNGERRLGYRGAQRFPLGFKTSDEMMTSRCLPAQLSVNVIVVHMKDVRINLNNRSRDE